MKSTRTRFAPSPTGYLHVGGIRTALFAWLIARQSGGRFILRLEDTDKVREVEGSGQHIQDSLRWLGLTWDEGLSVGGPYAPYTQSDRLDSYREWAQKLIDAGRAYADPYSPAEVDAFRAEAKTAKKAFLYRDYRPENPPAWDGSQPLRFKSDPVAYTWHDEIMGELSAGEEAIDDFILIKSDGYPTYNFAHIIDDYLMQCTHVTRSQEFLASTPKYLNLYEALDIERPLLVTMPPVMGPDGKKKLSKRDGAKDILDYARDGYLPEALINFMASLGWNDGTEQEIFTVDELIQKFSLNRVQKGGAKFDEARLLWMNGQHIRRLPLDDLYQRTTATSITTNETRHFWPAEAESADESYKKRILTLVQDRLKTLADLSTLTRYFFVEPPVDMTLIDNNKQLKKLSRDEMRNVLDQARHELESSDFSPEALTTTLNNLLEKTGQKPAVLFGLIRIATTWAPFSPSLADTLAILGKETTIHRLNGTINVL